MDFSSLEGFHTKWRDILVIGKTIERGSMKYHVVGMTLSDEARLYVIEPCPEAESLSGKVVQNQRQILKELERHGHGYLDCRGFSLGNEHMKVQGGTGTPLTPDNHGMTQLFFDMMDASWTIPGWLKEVDWDNLMLIALDVANVEKLPAFTPDMPMTITHRPSPDRHVVEKTVTLNVGKSRSFRFTDEHGDEVQCHINNVTLIDAWKSAEEDLSRFDSSGDTNDKRSVCEPVCAGKPESGESGGSGKAEQLSPEHLERFKELGHDALEQNCPKGMCYVGVEYECSKDLNLVFYSKQYLDSQPQTHEGSSHFLMMRLRPDAETGTHGLPLKGCVIQTPVPPDTSEIPAELFMYYEKTGEWTEMVS